MDPWQFRRACTSTSHSASFQCCSPRAAARTPPVHVRRSRPSRTPATWSRTRSPPPRPRPWLPSHRAARSRPASRRTPSWPATPCTRSQICTVWHLTCWPTTTRGRRVCSTRCWSATSSRSRPSRWCPTRRERQAMRRKTPVTMPRRPRPPRRPAPAARTRSSRATTRRASPTSTASRSKSCKRPTPATRSGTPS